MVKPRRFPGGSVGDLAVNGTVNDLAMMGAVPQWISASFIIEDGFSIAELRDLVADMAAAAIKAGVQIVTGDTKVVDKGACDGVYITTAGVGVIPAGIHLDAKAGFSDAKGLVLSLLRDAYQRRDKVGLITFRGAEATLALPPTSSIE